MCIFSYNPIPLYFSIYSTIWQQLKHSIRTIHKNCTNIKLGICGEHGGDPSSIEFCHKVGLDYVSCSPYRVPVAYIAAAQSAIEAKNK